MGEKGEKWRKRFKGVSLRGLEKRVEEKFCHKNDITIENWSKISSKNMNFEIDILPLFFKDTGLKGSWKIAKQSRHIFGGHPVLIENGILCTTLIEYEKLLEKF